MGPVLSQIAERAAQYRKLYGMEPDRIVLLEVPPSVREALVVEMLATLNVKLNG